MLRIWGWGFALALLFAGTARAAELTSVEPSQLKQGDTALLTLRGTDLPAGVLVIEFFPQQIAVIDILSQSATEVTAQVKVPALAPPGTYNVLLFNQIGEEAFGKELLTVTSTVLTPVFRNHDPKVIAMADSAFALLLTGDSITPEAAAHLSADWSQNGHNLGGMYTTFSFAAGSVMCAVTGRLPTGRVLGRIKMDDRPIYQLEIEIRGPSAIIGHAPTSINSANGIQTIKLVGSDFSAPYLSQMTATLRSGKKLIETDAVVLRDGATAELEFPGPLPEGNLQLSVAQGGVVVYEGPLKVLPALPEPEPVQPVVEPELPVPAEPEPIQAEPAVPEPAPVQQGESNREPLYADLSPTVFQEVELGPVRQPPVQQTAEQGPAAAVAANPLARISKVTPTRLPSGSEPFRVEIAGDNLAPELLDRLEVSVESGGQQALEQLKLATGGGLTVMFLPPADGWRDPSQASISVTDPQGQLPAFTQPLGDDAPAPSVEAPIIEPRLPEASLPKATPVEVQPPAAQWRIAQAIVSRDRGNVALRLALMPPQAEWEPRLLSVQYLLKPADSALSTLFTNLALAGELQFRREGAEAVTERRGNFVAGELELTLRYADAPPQVLTAALEAPAPAATVTAPLVREIGVDERGRAKPGELRWGIDFAPFEPSPTLPLSVDAGGLELPQLAVGVRGTTLIVAQPLDSLGSADSLALSLKLPDGVQADTGTLLVPIRRAGAVAPVTPPDVPTQPEVEPPSGEAEPTVEPTSASPAADLPAGFQLLPLDEPAQLGEGGFSLRLELSGAAPTGANWSAAELATQHAMLGPNVAKFAVAADMQQDGSRELLVLHFMRNRSELPEMAWDVLRTDLLEGGPVSLRIGWPQLGIAAEVTARFEAEQTPEPAAEEAS